MYILHLKFDHIKKYMDHIDAVNNVNGANVVYVVASAFADVVRKIPLHKGITKGLKII